MGEASSTEQGDIAGLAELIVQYGAACRTEGAGNSPEVDALAKRIGRRMRRLELLSRMGGIEPSDVRGALIGTWRH